MLTRVIVIFIRDLDLLILEKHPRPQYQRTVMHRFDSTTSKILIAELLISMTEEKMFDQEDELFNDDAFSDMPASKSHASWTCVVRQRVRVLTNMARQPPCGSYCVPHHFFFQAAGPISIPSFPPHQSMSFLPLVKSEMTPKEMDGMLNYQCRRIYNVLHLQALRVSNFSEGIFCFLETPVFTEMERTFVKFLPGQHINSHSNIFWKFFVSSDDLNMKAVPRDWRVLSRHSSGLSADMVLQPFVSEILKCLYQHHEGFDQFHIHHISMESCRFSIFATLHGSYQSSARISLLKIITEVVVKGEFKIELLATVDVGIC
jgi:hypothetical protein